MSAEATGAQTAVAIGAATATDAVGVESITSDAPADFPVGETVVTWTATDAVGNSSSAEQTITIVDTTPPVVTPPADITLEATATLTPIDVGMATATDAVGVVSITSDAPEIFPVGTTAVIWTATDAAGNAGTATQTITITDTTPPKVTLIGVDPVVLECPDPYIDPGIAVTDNSDPDPVVIVDDSAVSINLPGEYTVTYTVTDAHGNATMATRSVKMQDTTLPEIVLEGEASMVLECPVPYVEPGAQASDTCDPEPQLTIAGTVDATQPGSYTVTYTAVDASGNEASLTRQVIVEDTTPPSVSAALEDVRGNGRRGDDGDVGDGDGGVHFRVALDAEDACDCCGLDVIAHIAQPLTWSDPFELRYQRDRRKIGIRIERTKKRLRVTLSGPDEDALTGFWEEALERGGFRVRDDQIVKLVAIGPKGDDDDDAGDDSGSIQFRFDLDYTLTEAHLPMPTMVAYALDASGNQSDVVEVMPPYPWLWRAKPVAPPAGLAEGQALSYPNPFNATTQIGYWLPEEGEVAVVIYNTAGQAVRALMRDYQLRGFHQVEWDGRDGNGREVSSGVYFYRIISEGFVRRHVETRRMLLLR